MSKSNKKDMGKGIRALLSNIESDTKKPKNRTENSESKSSIAEIDISSIEANPHQPRKEFDSQLLSELKESIETFGVIQPITVRRLNDYNYQIISGERRWRASQLAGLKTVPVYIREADDQGMLEMALLENIQRADLNPLEIALSYQSLIDECDLTHEALSTRLGKKRSSISNHLRVLKLSPIAQKALRDSHITMGHAKILAGITKIEEQVEVLDVIIADELSVRATEDLISKASKPKAPSDSKSNKEVHPEVRKYQDRLSEVLGSKVAIDRSAEGKGAVKIKFQSDSELNSIMDVLLKS